MICNFEKSYFDFDLFADGSWGWPDVGQLTTRHRELADDRWWSIFYHPSIDLRRVAPNENSSSRCSGIKQTVHSPTKPNDHRIFCEQTLSARSSFLESASFSKCRLEAPFYFRERTNRWKKKKKKITLIYFPWHDRYACSIGIERWTQASGENAIERSLFSTLKYILLKTRARLYFTIARLYNREI